MLMFSFLGRLARQKKAIAFPTGKRKKKKNKGNFPLNMVGGTLEAKLTQGLLTEKEILCNQGVTFPLGLLWLSL